MNNLRQRLSIVHVDDDAIEIADVETDLAKGTDETSFDVTSFSSTGQYRNFMAEGRQPDGVILDVHFKNEVVTGLDLAKETKEAWPDTAVIIRTTDHHLVQDALMNGADDFIGKESFEGELCLRTIKTVNLVKERSGKEDQSPSELQRDLQSSVVGDTMRTAARRIERIVGSAVRAVHVCGESGAGKEVIADLFNKTTGSGKPFVRVNCGAIPEKLFESELFGSIKGAYTGALKDRMGLVEHANHGFLFLDEIATIPPSCQVKLLRLIDNQESKRVGDSNVRSVDVRVITATNENLQELVEAGAFRNDLYQRMREAEINLPPLRERPNEIRELIDYFCSSVKGGPYQMTEPTKSILCQYDWREGNVRELRNCIRAMTENHVDKWLTPVSIPKSLWDRIKDVDRDGEANDPTSVKGKNLQLSWDGEEMPPYDKLSDFLLLEMIRAVQKKTGKNSLRSMESIIGLSRTALSERLRGMVNKEILTAEDLKNLVGLDM